MHFPSSNLDHAKYMESISRKISETDIDEALELVADWEIGIYAIGWWGQSIILSNRHAFIIYKRTTDGFIEITPDGKDEDTNVMWNWSYIQVTIHGESLWFKDLRSYNRVLEDARKWWNTKAGNFSLLEFFWRDKDSKVWKKLAELGM